MKRRILAIFAIIMAIYAFAGTDWRTQPMRITAREDGTTIYLICHVDNDKPITVHYDIYNRLNTLLCSYTMQTYEKYDGSNTELKGFLVGEETPDEGIALWLTLTAGRHRNTMNKGDYVVVYGENPNGIGSGDYSHERHLTHNFKTGTVDIAGNVMSLLYGKEESVLDTAQYIPRDVCFARLFNQNGYASSDAILEGMTTGPVDVSNFYLPSTKLTHACYDRMFNSCNVLKNFPALPATEMADFCYLQMFGGCYSVETATPLAAVDMSYNCCRHMYQNCYGLKQAPYLPATTLASCCYDGIFAGCRSLEEVKVQFLNWKDSNGAGCTNSWLEGVPTSCVLDHPYQLSYDLSEDVSRAAGLQTTCTRVIKEDKVLTDADGEYQNRHLDIQDTAILTLNTNKLSVGNFIIAAEAGLVLPVGNSIRTAGPIIGINGKGIQADKPMGTLAIQGSMLAPNGSNEQVPCTLRYTINDERWYPIFLPGECTHVDTTDAQLVDIEYYTTTRGRGWREKNGGGTLSGGKGYRIKATPLDGKSTATIDFALAMNIYTAAQDANIAISYDKTTVVKDDKRSWNVIGNPYLTPFHGSMSQRFVYTTDDFTSYTPMRSEEATLQPFECFFVQAASEDDIILSYAEAEEQDEVMEADVLMEAEDTQVRTGVLFADEFTNAYEYDADLALMTGEGNQIQLYGCPSDIAFPLAFTALNGSSLSSGEVSLPIGYKVTNSDAMLHFKLGERVSKYFTHIWLDDKQKSTSTDLLKNDYNAQAGELTSDSRFTIRFTTEGYTGTEDIISPVDKAVRKVLINGQIRIIRDGKMYDVMGNQL